ncbi:MAG: hypothetical protein HY760_04260, partial [Nitrospirae bacterium]|nr:hypothetical protein [Nitrospirota bacterium]
MSRRLLILGYGRLGQAFHRKYHSRYEIRGVKRTPLPDDRCSLILAPIQSDAIVPHLPWAEEILFCPAPGGRGSLDAEGNLSDYRETYLGNMTFLIDRLRRGKITPRRFILIGSTGIYPRSQEGPWMGDRPIPVETPRQEILLKTEQVLIASGLPYLILRCGGLVGEGRDNFFHLQRRERFRTSEMTDDKIALVDQEDLCDLIDLAIQREIRNEIYN